MLSARRGHGERGPAPPGVTGSPRGTPNSEIPGVWMISWASCARVPLSSRFLRGPASASLPFSCALLSAGSLPPPAARSWKEVAAFRWFLGTELPLQLGKQRSFQADKEIGQMQPGWNSWAASPHRGAGGSGRMARGVQGEMLLGPGWKKKANPIPGGF